MNGPQNSRLAQACMDRPRPVALGAAGGSLGTALLGLVTQALFHDRRFVEPPICVCPEFPLTEPLVNFIEDRHLICFGIGLAVGICFGPILDICLVLRERWRRFVVNRLFGQHCSAQRPLHKVIS